MLQLRNLTYHPAATPEPILKDISMTLYPSQLGLIVGSSGAGKSTLLEILAGLVSPSRGEIAWQDQVLTPTRLRSLAGLVFQFPERHFCGLTVLEELRFGHPEIEDQQIQRALTQVGLEALPLHQSPNQLSGGQQRRLAVAVQLIRSPFLLLLDEPTAGLDWSVRQQLIDLLGSLKSGWSILVVTHDPQELGELADVQWQIQAGRIQQR
ncbi:MAG: ABC transporter ATP-binding protein [Cyanophyceae cyanobacterium]